MSAASTVIWFWTPDTSTLLQWPVITTVVGDSADADAAVVAGDGLDFADAGDTEVATRRG